MRQAALAFASTLALFACSPSAPPEQSADTATTATPPATAATPAVATGPSAEELAQKIAAFPAPYNQGDYEAGKRLYNQCKACHTVAEGGPNLVGPNLHGVFGRKAGTVESFNNYSDGMKAAGWTWDEAQMDKWIADPRAVLPKTNMVFIGFKDETQRRDVITYLKVESAS